MGSIKLNDMKCDGVTATKAEQLKSLEEWFEDTTRLNFLRLHLIMDRVCVEHGNYRNADSLITKLKRQKVIEYGGNKTWHLCDDFADNISIILKEAKK